MFCSMHAMDSSGAAPADLLTARMAAEPSLIHISVSVSNLNMSNLLELCFREKTIDNAFYLQVSPIAKIAM